MITKFLHTVLLCSVLFSSTGVWLGKNHCKRMEQAQGKQVASCASLGGCEEGCCHTEFEYFQLDQDQQLPPFGIEFPIPQIIFPQPFLFNFNVPPILDGQTLRYLTYRPPIVLRDISVLFQIFRC